MPTVSRRDWSRRNVSVVCPLCTDGTRIARDASAWRTHMESTHSATPGTWTDAGIRGGEEGLADGRNRVYKYAAKCYGCGGTFSSNTLLVNHLADVHDAT